MAKNVFDTGKKYGGPIAKVKTGIDIANHVQKCEAASVARDPYYQHMPKNDAAQATIYAAKMGGEHHDSSECLIS